MHEATRRGTIAAAGGVLTGSLAGCLGTGEENENDDQGTDSYTVEIEPHGELTFDAVPQDWVASTGDYADMGVALGQGEGLLAVGLAGRFQSQFYDELPGVSVDTSELTELWGGDSTDPEMFYELDADVHLIDPNFMINRIGWDQSDVDDVESTAGPFAGNTVFSGSYSWHEDYEYYTLYEAFENVAEIFQERERYEAFASLHEDVQATLEELVPEDTPEVAVLLPKGDQPDAFYPYQIDQGTSYKHYRDVGVGDALAEAGVKDFHETRSTIDFERLAEADPEVIAIRESSPGPREDFEDGIVSYLENHSVGSGLTAVQEGRVVRGGAIYQGPIGHLFQLERLAADLFPDAVEEGDLFDREEVAEIVTDDS